MIFVDPVAATPPSATAQWQGLGVEQPGLGAQEQTLAGLFAALLASAVQVASVQPEKAAGDSALASGQAAEQTREEIPHDGTDEAAATEEATSTAAAPTGPRVAAVSQPLAAAPARPALEPTAFSGAATSDSSAAPAPDFAGHSANQEPPPRDPAPRAPLVPTNTDLATLETESRRRATTEIGNPPKASLSRQARLPPAHEATLAAPLPASGPVLAASEPIPIEARRESPAHEGVQPVVERAPKPIPPAADAPEKPLPEVARPSAANGEPSLPPPATHGSPSLLDHRTHGRRVSENRQQESDQATEPPAPDSFDTADAEDSERLQATAALPKAPPTEAPIEASIEPMIEPMIKPPHEPSSPQPTSDPPPPQPAPQRVDREAAVTRKPDVQSAPEPRLEVKLNPDQPPPGSELQPHPPEREARAEPVPGQRTPEPPVHSAAESRPERIEARPELPGAAKEEAPSSTEPDVSGRSPHAQPPDRDAAARGQRKAARAPEWERGRPAPRAVIGPEQMAVEPDLPSKQPAPAPGEPAVLFQTGVPASAKEHQEPQASSIPLALSPDPGLKPSESAARPAVAKFVTGESPRQARTPAEPPAKLAFALAIEPEPRLESVGSPHMESRPASRAGAPAPVEPPRPTDNPALPGDHAAPESLDSEEPRQPGRPVGNEPAPASPRVPGGQPKSAQEAQPRHPASAARPDAIEPGLAESVGNPEPVAPKSQPLSQPAEALPQPAAPLSSLVAPVEPSAPASPRSEPALNLVEAPAASAEVEAAELEQRPDRTQFRLVLRDDHLGRVSLNLTERAGLIDLMVRADKSTTVRTLQDALPLLIESLSQRNFRSEATAFAPPNDPREPSQDRERRERRGQEHRPRIRARRVTGTFQVSAD